MSANKIPERVLSKSELDAICATLGFNPPPLTISVDEAPAQFAALIPYAEIWGHDDEDVRQEVRESTPPEFNLHLWWLRLDSGLHDPLEDWLTTPASKVRPLRFSYVALRCLCITLSELD
jgi:hypothetical protein